MTVSQTAHAVNQSAVDTFADMRRILELQRRAFEEEPVPIVAVRHSRIDRLLTAVLRNTDNLVAALDADFGQRAPAATLATDILGPLTDVLYIRRNLRTWSQPRRIRPGLHSVTASRVRIEPRPLGVVGIVAPWNFPVTLALQPAFAALAAGNRVMLKVSELTPRTAGVLSNLVAESMGPDEVVVVEGDAEVAAAFSTLPFDHLFFTGSPQTGRHVARAAADNLVPVTLELGGKNPAVIGRDADLNRAAERITTGRMTNGGQLCLCPDYVLVPRTDTEDFIAAAQVSLRAKFPAIAGNRDYPWIVNERNFERVQHLVDDARSKGATVLSMAPAGEQSASPQHRWMAPTLVWNLSDEMDLSHQEVFGPVLGVVPYDDIDDALAYIAARPAPLAAYWFGGETADYRRFAARVRCGGLARNDFAVQALPNGAPFGGVGASGSGYYHGRAGFDTFSHLRTTVTASTRFSVMALASPPFHPRSEAVMRKVVAGLLAVSQRRAAASGRAADRQYTQVGGGR